MTKYYGMTPLEIRELTLFQWQTYMEHIEKVYKVFHPESKDKGNKGKSGSPGNSDKGSHEELKSLARRKGIKLPTKGM